MPEYTGSIPEIVIIPEELPHQATQLVDNLKANGAKQDSRKRRISLDRLSNKVSKRRQSLPVLPSYITLTSPEEKVSKKKERKEVTFPVGVMMHQIISEGEVEELKELFHKHGNKIVDEKEPNGLPPVMRAMFEDQIECLKVLLEAGADVTAQDLEEWNALHVASAMDSLEAVKMILQVGKGKLMGLTQTRNVDGERPIDLAESKEMSQLLVEADLAEFRLDCHTAEEHVSHTEAGEAEVLELIRKCYNTLAVLDAVLRKNTSYSSVLHLAAAKGYSRLADYVFTHWVPALESRNENGWTPLHTAAYFNNVDMTLLLVDRGANIHAISHSFEKPSDLTENELIQSFLEL